MKKIFLFFIIFLLSTLTHAQNLVSIADSICIKNKIPQIAFAVLTNKKVLEIQSIGYHKLGFIDNENKAKITDYFHLGSNTKAITGFIAAYLVENKKIKWETKFFDLFPLWKKESNSQYYNITLEDLLSHRAHIQPYTNGEEQEKLPKFKGSKSEKRKQFGKFVLTEKPVESNKVYNYSNAGYSIATIMLEKATGETWEKLVDDILSKKLKLKYKFGWPNRYKTKQPWGHWVENDTLKSVPPQTNYNLNLIEPGGDISMPIIDYAKFIQLNLDGLRGNDNFLKAKTYAFLHYDRDEYSIGWANSEKKISEHAGSDGTFFSYTQINKNKNIAYIILINNATEEAQNGLFEILRLMKTKYEK